MKDDILTLMELEALRETIRDEYTRLVLLNHEVIHEKAFMVRLKEVEQELREAGLQPSDVSLFNTTFETIYLWIKEVRLRKMLEVMNEQDKLLSQLYSRKDQLEGE